MPLDDYLVGCAFFALTAGSVLAAAWFVVRRRLAHLPSAAAALAVATVATAGIVAVHLLPGLVGLLSREAALACALAALVVSARLGPAPSEPDPVRPPPPESGPLSWGLAALAVVVLGSATAASMWSGSTSPSSDIDTLTFHLPNVARWIQTGTFWQVDQFNPLLANGNYPQNGDVVFLATILPWENDAFARLLGVPFAAVAGLSVYAMAVRVGAARATGVIAGAVFASLPALVFAAHEGAKTDAIMLAGFGSGAFFLLRHFDTARRSDLVLAGLGLGLAFGTKWYGVTSVAALIAAWALVWMAARRPAAQLLRNAGALAGLVSLAGGFWLVRNWVESGNPVFPTSVALGGLTVFDAPRDFVRECGGFTIAGYLDQPGIWKEFIYPAYRGNYGLPGLLLAVGWGLGLAMAVRERRRGHGRSARSAQSVAVLLLGAALAAAAYAVTPYSAFGAENEPTLIGANTRWLLPAFLLAAPLFAWAVSRTRRAWIGELLAVVAALEGVGRGFFDPRGEVAIAALCIALAALSVLLVLRAARAAGLPRRSAIAIPAVLAIVALVAVGHTRQQRFNDARYISGEPPVAWFAQHAPSGARVGLAGVWGVNGLSPVLPAFGPRLRNEVRFVGRYVNGQLREYDSRSEFLAAVRRGRYDLLAVGNEGYGDCDVPGRDGDEDAWARSAGFEPVAESGRLTLFRVRSRR